eukprot:s1994_g4.t1
MDGGFRLPWRYTAALGLLTAAGKLGDALGPVLVSDAPLLLLVLNANDLHLGLTTPNTHWLPWYIIGTLRRLAEDPVFFLIGWHYSDRCHGERYPAPSDGFGACAVQSSLCGGSPGFSWAAEPYQAKPRLSSPFGGQGRPTGSSKLLLAPLAAEAQPGIPATADVLPPWAAAWSGALQGIAQNVAKQVVLHPFDTVKTRLQATAGRPDASRAELFRDVYRGLLPTLVSSATFFAAKEAASAQLRRQAAPDPLPTLGGVVLGVLSAKAVKTPFDVAETKAMATVATEGEALAWDGSWGKLQDTYEKDCGAWSGYFLQDQYG